MDTRLLLCSLLLSVIWNVNAKPDTTPVSSQAESETYVPQFNDFVLSEVSLPNTDVAVTQWTIPLFKTGKKKYYLGTFFKANWFQAMQFCRYHGMDLASISSQKENDDLLQYIIDSGYGKERFWTSGTDLAEEGKFFWAANGRPFTFTNWYTRQPDNKNWIGENENCVDMVDLYPVEHIGIKWNDENCFSRSMYFICEAMSN